MTRDRIHDGILIESALEDRPVFADKAGRYVIHMSRQLYLTPDNHFEDHSRSLVF